VCRVQQHGGFGVGLNHHIEILVGARTEKIRKLNHTALSTYGIGTDIPRNDWFHIARELIRLGYLSQNAEKYNILEPTPEGLAALKQRTPITIAQPIAKAEKKPRTVTGDIPCDDALFRRLRELRRRVADEHGVPPYIIFNDVSLRYMAREYPATPGKLLDIPGVGQHKLQEFGIAFLAEINAYLATNSRQNFAPLASSTPPPPRRSLGDSTRETMRHYRTGKTPEQIAKIRNLATSTIYGHLAEAIELGEPIDPATFFTPAEFETIAAAFTKHGTAVLAPVHEALGGKVDYARLRIFRALASRSHPVVP